MDDTPLTRRRALQLAGSALAVGVAGCNTAGDETTTTTENGPSGDETLTVTTALGTVTRSTDDGSVTGTTEADTATPPEAPGDLVIGASRVASGFTSPVGIEIPQPGRRFVVDQVGQIYLHDDGGLHEEPFLDVSDRMVDIGGYSERGLLGLAFHPEFAQNGRFYVRYSAPRRAGTPSDYSHTFVLSEFEADPAGTRADPASERTVMEIPQPQSNHNAGAIVFGPDGYLYVATGDGGGGGDTGTGHADDWYDGNAGGNGQDVTTNLLGSILRIDVDGREDGKGYAVPDDNPLTDSEGYDEQYAWGFRNPWRLSFAPDGRLFAADVGQNAYEEVDVVVRGGNYGWNVKEGTHCYDATDCPDETPDGEPLRDPVIEYPHGGGEISGISVIGGYLYQGTAMPTLQGRYVFADWQAEGRLFAATPTADGLWPISTVGVESEEQFGPNVLSFGRNPAGELFVCTTATSGVSGSSGAVFRLQAA